MKAGVSYIIGGDYYKAERKDNGFPHPEDKGLWRCIKVKWNRERLFWNAVDDEDYMISDDYEIVAKEYGWDLRREKLWLS